MSRSKGTSRSTRREAHPGPRPDPSLAARSAARFARALPLHQAGRLEDAETIYRDILADDPAHFDARHMLGVVHLQRGEHIAALRNIDAALKTNPAAAAAHNNRGTALASLGRLDEAAGCYERAVALAPDYLDALINLGNTRKDLGRLDEALASYDRALAISPRHALALVKRGNVLHAMQRHDEAIASYDRALASAPDLDEAWHNRGAALARAGRPADAVASYDRALALRPDDAETLRHRGMTLADLRRFDEALASYQRAMELDPDQDELAGVHLHARMHLCDWAGFDAACVRLSAAVDGGALATHPFNLLACPSTPARQLAAARTYVGKRHPAAAEPLWRGERYAHARIRVAYLSPDLRDHPVASLTAGLFAGHDRARFETFAVSFGRDEPSDMRTRMKAAFDRFIDADAMSDDAVAALVRELEIDIAVDLAGLTGGSRPGIFARRPAPVQVSYLGYAGTLGGDHWDYIVADRFVLPEAAQPHYAEKVVYLPDSFMATDSDRKISPRTPSRAEAGLPDGLVFCSLNNLFKITPDLFDVWMRLLRATPGSALWLPRSNPAAAGNLRREAEGRGVDPDRLVFAAPTPRKEDHLARLRLADLFLDTHYYNAHASAADALWAGLPVLTCAGATFASRVAGSLLHAVGLPDLATGSLADYEALALRLAAEPALLAALRGRLARDRGICPLFDTARFTRHIEAAYTAMWRRAERGEPPQSFSVDPIEAAGRP
jgi:predicted O-linked N-acetylglucosamine transferase (SPINDLY family)